MRFFIFFMICIIPLCAAFDTLKSLQGTFLQEIATLEGESIVYSGKIYMKKPALVRWDYEKPTPKQLFFDGKEAKIYEPQLEQLTIIKIDDKVLDFSTLLKNAKKQSDGRYHAVIEGKEYVLSVDSKEIPSFVEYLDEFDNTVKISFHDCQPNINIADSFFEFDPPSGIDIVQYER